ncbi:sulfotransferase family protein [Hyphomonas sp.]|uniref:sulfotransferase family protein n=1 Tax=Hyphomonas sp. TaxID=87 RepID=UPI0032428611
MGISLAVFSAGFSRTGTMSLKLALERLGFGPCHHMIDVIRHHKQQVPLWKEALQGRPDFRAIYSGYSAAVDWPTAAFWRELAAAYPHAKIILSSRSAESWVESMSDTLLDERWSTRHWSGPAADWSAMVGQVLGCVFKEGMGRDDLVAAFHAHETAVKAEIPAERLLVHSAKDGWEPLCAHLGVPTPDEPYPRTNGKEEFAEHMREVDDM